ncbi:putative polygalacturonase, partial [Cucurbita argyrosperma subsp. argyrosperma]
MPMEELCKNPIKAHMRGCYGRWGKFDVVIKDLNEWPVIEPLPSYGHGRDTSGGRYISLIFGTNLTDVVVT